MLRSINNASRKPEVFQKSKQEFWQNRYIRNHVLNAHLDPNAEDGSRNHEVIGQSVNWIHHHIGEPGSLLDLGCGPGLYAHQFAALGWRVSGIDFSRTSIRYAKSKARSLGLQTKCRFRCLDYLNHALPAKQNLVTLIYGNFCVLSRDDQKRLLDRIRDSLAPSGYLVLDVFTTDYVAKHRINNEWYAQSGSGFWSGRPHLVLQDSHEYQQSVFLNRYTVVPSIGKTRTFHLWYHPLDAQRVTRLLEEQGFTDIELYSDLHGTAYDKTGLWIGVVARKQTHT